MLAGVCHIIAILQNGFVESHNIKEPFKRGRPEMYEYGTVICLHAGAPAAGDSAGAEEGPLGRQTAVRATRGGGAAGRPPSAASFIVHKCVLVSIICSSRH